MALRLASGLTLYFARHGETVANVEHRFQGWSRDTALTERGVAQAKAVASLLAHQVANPKNLRHLASPLPRARKTMEIILAALGLPQTDYATDDRIAEINLGAWDGLTHAEARALDPNAYEAREHDKWNVRVPGGGENYEDVARRAESWISDLDADTFAVSHGAFTRVLRGLFLGFTWKQMSDLDEPQGCLFCVRDNVVTRFDP
jgi:probable phosphoglycerate mutase